MPRGETAGRPAAAATSGAEVWTRRAALGAAVAAAGVTGAAIFTGARTGAGPAPGEGAPSSAPGAQGGEPAQPRRLWIIGDSLTAGWHATTRERGYAALLAQRLAGRYEVETAAVAGDTVTDAASRHPVPAGVDVSVVELGTNDLAAGTDPEQFLRSYEGLLGDIRAGSPDAQLLCLGSWYTAQEPAVGFMDRLIGSACTAHGGRFVDLSALYDDAANRGPAGQDTWTGPSDQFHPNDAGHAALAGLVARELGAE